MYSGKRFKIKLTPEDNEKGLYWCLINYSFGILDTCAYIENIKTSKAIRDIKQGHPSDTFGPLVRGL